MRKERRIQDQIETDARILLEYGVPLDTIPYKKIWEKTDPDYSQDVTNEAADIVEKETREGRPGAFVIRLMLDNEGTDNVEVWGWAD